MSLATLLEAGRPLLADGATGTNLFAMGLQSGDPPELWNSGTPELMADYAGLAMDAGAAIIGGCCGRSGGANGMLIRTAQASAGFGCEPPHIRVIPLRAAAAMSVADETRAC